MLIQLLRADHVTLDRERGELALQPKTKSARFVDRMDFSSLTCEFGRPMHKRFFLKALRRLGIACPHLHHHHVKLLVHINPKLDHLDATIKLAAGSLE